MARQEGAGGGTLPARLTWVGATAICGAVAGLLLFLAAINSSAGLLAGAAGLGVGLLFGLFFHRTSTNYSYGDFLRRLIAVIAGGAYGAVVGVTAAYLRAAR